MTESKHILGAWQESISLYQKSLMVRKKKKTKSEHLRLRLAHAARSLQSYKHWLFSLPNYDSSNQFAQGNISRLSMMSLSCERRPTSEDHRSLFPLGIKQPSNETSSLYGPPFCLKALRLIRDTVSAVEPHSHRYSLEVTVNTQVFSHMVSPWHRHPWYHWAVM